MQEPPRTGLLLPESVPVHAIDEQQLLTGAMKAYAAFGSAHVHKQSPLSIHAADRPGALCTESITLLALIMADLVYDVLMLAT